ncbi:MAG: nitroreductase family protein [Spirochaetales bacterium]|nr:nitroreductase family protein [Spirochaetales bacterium]
MKFLDLIANRQSCRSYSSRPVEHEKIERCLEASRLAPSACNAQPWYFIVLDDPVLKEAIARATFSSLVGFNKFTLQAPVMIVIISEPQNLIPCIGSQLKGIPYRLVDIGIAAEHFCLQATEEGLATCLIGWFNERKIRNILKLTKSKKIELVISMGYAAQSDKLRKKVRKKIDQMRQYNIKSK